MMENVCTVTKMRKLDTLMNFKMKNGSENVLKGVLWSTIVRFARQNDSNGGKSGNMNAIMCK